MNGVAAAREKHTNTRGSEDRARGDGPCTDSVGQTEWALAWFSGDAWPSQTESAPSTRTNSSEGPIPEDIAAKMRSEAQAWDLRRERQQELDRSGLWLSMFSHRASPTSCRTRDKRRPCLCPAHCKNRSLRSADVVSQDAGPPVQSLRWVHMAPSATLQRPSRAASGHHAAHHKREQVMVVLGSRGASIDMVAVALSRTSGRHCEVPRRIGDSLGFESHRDCPQHLAFGSRRGRGPNHPAPRPRC